MPDVAMPRLSDSMEEGTIIKWLKGDGDEVQRGDEIAEIETDKATMTYEADSTGTLSIVAQEGDTLPIGEVIARIGEAGGGDGGADGEVASKGDDGSGQPTNGASAGSENGAGASAPAGAESKSSASASAAPAGAETESGASASAAPADPEPARASEPSAESGAAPGEYDQETGSAEATAPPAGSGNGEDGERVKASPVARRMAREAGLDLHDLHGTGPGGRVVKADVEAASRNGGAASAPAPADAGTPAADAPAEAGTAAPEAPSEPGATPAEPAAEARAEPQPASAEPAGEQTTTKGRATHEDLSRLQQTIARRMAEAKATVPEFTLQTEIEMEAAVELRGRLKEVGGDNPTPSYNDMVVKACALALKEFPRANGAYRDGRFELYDRVNVGVAVAGQDSLVVPVVFDADLKSLGRVTRDVRGLAEKVRAATITPPELSGGTFTVSNLGMYGVTNFTAVINPPQAAILAVGAIEQRAVVRDGRVTARHMMGVTLACDHRILYGADAARFLARIRELLEQPLALAL